jgi:hypothetical protein
MRQRALSLLSHYGAILQVSAPYHNTSKDLHLKLVTASLAIISLADASLAQTVVRCTTIFL